MSDFEAFLRGFLSRPNPASMSCWAWILVRTGFSDIGQLYSWKGGLSIDDRADFVDLDSFEGGCH